MNSRTITVQRDQGHLGSILTNDTSGIHYRTWTGGPPAAIPGRMPLPPKYIFTRDHWHTVENVSKDKVTWCSEQFGKRVVYPDAWTRWHYTWGLIKFRDERDYIWYTLRWGA